MNDVTLAIAATLEFARRDSHPQVVQMYGPAAETPPANWQKTPNQPAGAVSASPYEAITGVMTGQWREKSGDTRNTILSFNYDLTIEEALRSLGVSFNYGFGKQNVHKNDSGHDEKSELLLLKLHGSINWSVCSDDDYQGMYEIDKVNLFTDFAALSQAQMRPLLIPPTWRKVPIGGLSEVWQRAVEALVTATRIIIVGYSMPIIDQHFKYLLAAGLQRNISLRNIIIANPALGTNHRDYNALRARTFEVFKPELESRGIIEPWPYAASYCFFSPAFREKINRYLPKGFEEAQPSFIS
jgi:hypothetical protein